MPNTKYGESKRIPQLTSAQAVTAQCVSTLSGGGWSGGWVGEWLGDEFDGWIYGWKDGLEWVEEWIGRIDGFEMDFMVGCMNRLVDGWMNEQINGRMVVWIDG